MDGGLRMGIRRVEEWKRRGLFFDFILVLYLINYHYEFETDID